jgi:hypothetical protein
VKKQPIDESLKKPPLAYQQTDGYPRNRQHLCAGFEEQSHRE